jgi:SAM-dependent methyltransferase
MMSTDIFPNLTAAEAARYLELQAERSRPLRLHCYRAIGIAHMSRVLEVGCGSGAILQELQAKVPFAAGVDPSPAPRLSRAVGGVGERLPFRAGVFQALFLHYALLWVRGLPAFFSEARRVLAPGAPLVLLAEPLIGEVRGADGEAFRRIHRDAGIHTFTLDGLNAVLREHGFTPVLERSMEDEASDPEWDALNAKLLGRRMDLRLPLAYGIAT